MAELDENDRETLTAYLDGELDDAATEALEARLGQDPKLRAELETMQKTWGMLDFLPKAEPSPDFTNRTIDRLTLAVELFVVWLIFVPRKTSLCRRIVGCW